MCSVWFISWTKPWYGLITVSVFRDWRYLQRVFGADGQDLVLKVTKLTAPGAPLADPADETGLMCAAH